MSPGVPKILQISATGHVFPAMLAIVQHKYVEGTENRSNLIHVLPLLLLVVGLLPRGEGGDVHVHDLRLANENVFSGGERGASLADLLPHGRGGGIELVEDRLIIDVDHIGAGR